MKQLVILFLLIPFLFSCSDDEAKPKADTNSIYYRVDNLSKSELKIRLVYSNPNPNNNDTQLIEEKILSASGTWEKTITPKIDYKNIILWTEGSNYRVRAIRDEFNFDKTHTTNTGLEFETNTNP